MDALLEVPHSTDSAGDAVKDCTTNEKGVSALDSKLMPTPSIGILGSAANQVGQLHSHALLPCSSRQYCNQKPRRAIQLAPSMDASRWAGLRSDAATMQGQLSLQRALVRDMVMQSVAARRSEVERRLECGYPYQHYSTTTTTTTGTNSRIAPSAVTSTSILRRMLADALSE